MKTKLNFAAIVAALFLSAPAFASLTYATGQDLDADGMDDQFAVNGKQAFLVTSAAQGWPLLPQATVTSGRYISWDPIQSGRPSTVLRDMAYNYSFNFNWGTPADVVSTGTTVQESTMFDFRWISDDYLLDVTLNGDSLGVSNIGAQKVWRISNSASVMGFLNPGVNTINFLLNNSGGGANGLAADFTIHGKAAPVEPGNGPTDVPEPAPFALMALGLVAGLVASRKRA